MTSYTSLPDRASLHDRTWAFAWDYLLITLYMLLLVTVVLLVKTIYPTLLSILYQGAFRSQLTSFLLLTLPVTFYFVYSEISVQGATWGKQRRNLYVLTTVGNRLSLWQSIVRNTVKFVPWELAHACIWQFTEYPDNPPSLATAGLIAVWLMIGINVVSMLISPTQQTLYDRLAGTIVVKHDP